MPKQGEEENVKKIKIWTREDDQVLPTSIRPQFASPTYKKQGAIMQTHNPSTGEAEAEGSLGLAGQPT